MTDLDRQIVEVKGWEWDPKAMGWWPTPRDKETGTYCFGGLGWSVLDAAAFDLVDELTQADASKPHNFGLRMMYFPEMGWQVQFIAFETGKHMIKWKEVHEAPTRPEAICRAYLAAMEWMKGRKA